MQANKESEARHNVGILFDDNRLNEETARLEKKLADQQLGDGAWPWFPGGPANDYMTLYITTGYGRLRHLGVKLDIAPAVKSLERLDGWIDQIYREIIATATRTTIISTRRSRCISTAGRSSWKTSRSPPGIARRSIISSVRPRNIGSSSIAGSRKAIWPWRSSGSATSRRPPTS